MLAIYCTVLYFGLSAELENVKFFLIAWAGEPPTWSILDPKKIRGEREPGEITEAQWDDGNWYPCEVLVGASKLLCWQFDPVWGSSSEASILL